MAGENNGSSDNDMALIPEMPETDKDSKSSELLFLKGAALYLDATRFPKPNKFNQLLVWPLTLG